MARPARVQYSGAIYHVYFRGNNGQDIFYDDEDREYFMDRLRQTVNRYGWLMFVICLLTNHVHLLFQTPEANLSAGMQFLLSAFASHVNRRHGFKGHLLQGRYGSQLVEDESYYGTVSRYIHLNVYRAKMVERPEDWKWSTLQGYYNCQRRLDFVDYDGLLKAWAGTYGGDAQEAYRNFVNQGVTKPPVDPFSEAVDGWILGSNAFVEWIKEKVGIQQSPIDVPRQQRFLTVELEELLLRVADYFEVPIELLQQRRSRHPGRVVVAWLSRRYTRSTREELAELLQLGHPDSVTSLMRKANIVLDNDPEVARHFLSLEASLRADLPNNPFGGS